MAAQKQSTDSSVFALISSLTSGLDVFRKLKVKRHRRKHKKEEEAAAVREREEARLSHSLTRGPAEIQTEYEQNLAIHGERYREGDAHAHASLAAVLLKMNNGLVSIISSFLGNGKTGGKLDYDRLTILSESSRVEAIDALSQLSYRLSHSRLSNLLRPSAKRTEHDCDGRNTRTNTSRMKKSPTRGSGKPQPLRQITSANVTSPQLAMLRPQPRPRPKRAASSGSNSGNKANRPIPSNSRAHSVTMFPPPTSASPPRRQSPLPMQTPPVSPQSKEQHQRAYAGLKSRLAKSTPNLLSRNPKHSSQPLPTPPPSPFIHSTAQSRPLSPRLPPGPNATPATTVVNDDFVSSHLHPTSALLPRRRRTQKSVASMQTFSTASTKLGEIPQHKWVQPLNFAEMARLNASAAMVGSSAGQQDEAFVSGNGEKVKKGFWGSLFSKKPKLGSGIVVG